MCVGVQFPQLTCRASRSRGPLCPLCPVQTSSGTSWSPSLGGALPCSAAAAAAAAPPACQMRRQHCRRLSCHPASCCAGPWCRPARPPTACGAHEAVGDLQRRRRCSGQRAWPWRAADAHLRTRGRSLRRVAGPDLTTIGAFFPFCFYSPAAGLLFGSVVCRVGASVRQSGVRWCVRLLSYSLIHPETGSQFPCPVTGRPGLKGGSQTCRCVDNAAHTHTHRLPRPPARSLSPSLSLSHTHTWVSTDEAAGPKKKKPPAL